MLLEAHDQLSITLNHLVAHLFAEVRVNFIKGLDDLLVVLQHGACAVQTQSSNCLDSCCFLLKHRRIVLNYISGLGCELSLHSFLLRVS